MYVRWTVDIAPRDETGCIREDFTGPTTAKRSGEVVGVTEHAVLLIADDTTGRIVKVNSVVCEKIFGPLEKDTE